MFGNSHLKKTAQSQDPLEELCLVHLSHKGARCSEVSIHLSTKIIRAIFKPGGVHVIKV